jgi:hypothetical protein
VHTRAEWFSVDGFPRVDCRRRRVIRRLVFSLAAHRLARPGQALPRDVLIQAVWPDERIMEASAHNRLRVAVNGLRQWLGSSIETVGTTYRLATSVEVQFMDRPPTTAHGANARRGDRDDALEPRSPGRG